MKQLLSTQEVADCLNITRRQVRRLVCAGQLIPAKPARQGVESLFYQTDCVKLGPPRTNRRRCRGVSLDQFARVAWNIKIKTARFGILPFLTLSITGNSSRAQAVLDWYAPRLPPCEYIENIRSHIKQHKITHAMVMLVMGAMALYRRRPDPEPVRVWKKDRKRPAMVDRVDLGRRAFDTLCVDILGDGSPVNAKLLDAFWNNANEAAKNDDFNLLKESARQYCSESVYDFKNDRFKNPDVMEWFAWQRRLLGALGTDKAGKKIYYGRAERIAATYADIARLLKVSRQTVTRSAVGLRRCGRLECFSRWLGFDAAFLLPKYGAVRRVAHTAANGCPCCGEIVKLAGDVLKCSACAWKMSHKELVSVIEARKRIQMFPCIYCDALVPVQNESCPQCGRLL